MKSTLIKIFDKVINLAFLGKAGEWLNGKKTILGVVQIVLWVIITFIPIVLPEWSFLVGIAERIQSFLANVGIESSTQLSAGFMTFLVGLLGKLAKAMNRKVAV